VQITVYCRLTDVSAQNTFNLFLLKSTFNDQLVVAIDWTTTRQHEQQLCQR